MNHREASIRFLSNTGLIPVEVQPGDKKPSKDYDPRTIATANHRLRIERLIQHQELNLGALFYGTWVDVDVDSKSQELSMALDAVLPDTPFVWGRESKRRSHRIYKLDQDFDATCARALELSDKGMREFDLSVEIRGGKPENGKFAVLPGSFIDFGADNKDKGYADKGERIEWAGEPDTSVSPPIISLKMLSNRIRMAQAISLLAPYWTEGKRNDMSMALAGLLWRIRALTYSTVAEGDDFDPGYFALQKEDAITLMTALCSVAGDDARDLRSRLLNLENTWRKLENEPDAKVKGGGAIIDMIGEEPGRKIVSKLYRLLSDNNRAEELEKIYTKHAIWYGEGRLIDFDQVRMGLNPSMSYEQACNSMGRIKIELDGKFKPVVPILFATSMIPLVHGFTLDPTTNDLLVEEKDGVKKVNQWRGFKVAPHPDPVDPEYMRPLLDYFYSILASGNRELGDWILGWISHIFQTPENKSKTSLVLVGTQGAGKTFLGENVVRPIIGPYHSVQLSRSEDITGKHNTILDNKVFVQADEAVHSHRFVEAQAMKSLISDDTMNIEPKFVDRYTKPNLCRFLFTSNREEDAVYIDPTQKERRFTVVRVSDDKVGELEHWKTFATWCENNLPRIHRFFLDFKFDRTFVCRPYETRAKTLMKTSSAPIELVWITTRIREGYPLDPFIQKYWWEACNADLTQKKKEDNEIDRTRWPDFFIWEALTADLVAFASRRNRTVYHNPMTIMRKIIGEPKSALMPTVKYRTPDGSPVQRRIRQYKLPSREEVINRLKDAYGYDLIEELIRGHDDDAPSEKAYTEKEDKF